MHCSIDGTYSEGEHSYQWCANRTEDQKKAQSCFDKVVADFHGPHATQIGAAILLTSASRGHKLKSGPSATTTSSRSGAPSLREPPKSRPAAIGKKSSQTAPAQQRKFAMGLDVRTHAGDRRPSVHPGNVRWPS